MDVTVNLSTYHKRKDVLPQAIKSLKNQTVKPDKIRIWDNETRENITDKGKFAFLEPNEYYFTCDDDIYYPPGYIERTLEALSRYPNAIVCYHGRKLKGKGLNYYWDHKAFHFLRTLKHDTMIDVAGTGVCAFNTNKFMPDILQYEEDCMVDLLFSLEAPKNGKKIICLEHERGWIWSLKADDAIYRRFSNDCKRQSELADEIINQKCG